MDLNCYCLLHIHQEINYRQRYGMERATSGVSPKGHKDLYTNTWPLGPNDEHTGYGNLEGSLQLLDFMAVLLLCI